MAKNSPNLEKETDIQIQESQSSNDEESKENPLRHVKIEVSIVKDKGRIFKVARKQTNKKQMVM